MAFEKVEDLVAASSAVVPEVVQLVVGVPVVVVVVVAAEVAAVVAYEEPLGELERKVGSAVHFAAAVALSAAVEAVEQVVPVSAWHLEQMSWS